MSVRLGHIISVAAATLLVAVPLFCLAAEYDLVVKKGTSTTFHTDKYSGIENLWTLDGATLTPVGDSLTVEWSVDGDHLLSLAYLEGQCYSSPAYLRIYVEGTGLPPIRPHTFFTPNGDGNNDLWVIDNIEYYPDAIIEIYDRFHKLLARYYGRDLYWNGIYNGHPLPEADYWYIISDVSFIRPVSGHFILKR